jgi:Protein of unknown function (DUF1553)/Protein of unknown function (DUF1549)/Planctomycete cytochrome C
VNRRPAWYSPLTLDLFRYESQGQWYHKSMPHFPFKRRHVDLSETPQNVCRFVFAHVLAGIILAVSWGTVLAVGDGSTTDTIDGNSFPPAALEFFEARVRPILVDQCVKCHGPKKQSSGLRLDSREAMLNGGDSGPAIVPFKANESLLIQAVGHSHPELKMPPSGKLPWPAVALLREWVSLGAPWTVGTAKGVPSIMASASVTGAAAAHWAFQPVRRAVLPTVNDRKWLRTPLDAFVLARLDAAGLAPSREASKRTLIRRATMDLWGIPPTAEDVDAFESDTAPDAFNRLIDRLLASPRYGERWGRHWLDVARYADTKGYVFTQDRRYPYAYTYRDYVISALNADLGYDRFVVEQIAADQLPRGGDKEPLAALGFLTVGRRFLLDQNEIIDDRIDVVTRGLLGLTVTCARCHDHKFDPIPTEDYYSLYGVFASSVEPAELPLLGRAGDPARSADYNRKLAAATRARDQYLAARRDEFVADLQTRLSEYLRAACQLHFDPDNSELDERGLAGKLNTRRLRSLITMWKRYLEATSKVDDPVVGPWNAFAGLPKDQFAAKSSEVQRKLTGPNDAKAPPIHPLVARSVIGSPPANMDEVVERYTSLFAQLEARWKEHSAQSATPRALPESDWESLRQALFGACGSLQVSTDAMREFLDQEQAGQLDQLSGAIVDLESTHRGAPARAMVMNDATVPVDPHVFIRGNPGRQGPAVPRRFLRVLAEPDRRPFQKGSGRLEMARAIADPQNPLTARVLVNRVWLWHFGKGLVSTPSDFGLRSDPPSHPEMLDYLASEFVDSGWSLKTLHRQIMLSSTYRQCSEPRPQELRVDPENNLLWRFNRQRLDFESMRDSLLAVVGAIDPAIGGPPASITERPFSTRRTIYGFIDRQNLDGLYRTFDFAVPDATSPRRFQTTVPQQALFLMNSPFLHEQARQLTTSIGLPPDGASTAPGTGSAGDPAEGVRQIYRRVLGRSPEPDELGLAIEFVRRKSDTTPTEQRAWARSHDPKADQPLSPWEQLSQVLLLTNEFMFVD